ncbi:MAG: cyclic nucleotide-binding domain-containing protein [Verrucomicrobia bacterium]|nr:cyclic nucleotide-binding domain-containing protein [Verrucomicrobiota bacterium]
MLPLEKSKLFHGLLAEELQTLHRTAHLRKFASGQTIFVEGDPGDGLYVILDGLVKISALVTQQERRVLSHVGPGDFFGEMAVLDDEARSATATAEEDTTVYFLPREELVALLSRSPKLALTLVREFSLRMREVNRQYIQEVLQAERLTLVGRFARSIVHDFKNPLNIIGLAADMASMERATPEMRQSAAKRVHRQVARLSNMISELLEFTRGAQASVVLASTNYAQFVSQLMEEIEPELADKNVRLALAAPPALNLLLDPQRLTHVFYNLIHNAVDEMPDGGKITIRFLVSDKEVVTEFEDTGSGIKPEIAAKLFEPFATFGKSKGTGLGLSICKRIVEDHRGSISVRSTAGKGATFAFSIPRPR